MQEDHQQRCLDQAAINGTCSLSSVISFLDPTLLYTKSKGHSINLSHRESVYLPLCAKSELSIVYTTNTTVLARKSKRRTS